MQLWLVIQWKDTVVEITGIFDKEEKAVDSCVDEFYCIGPLTLNQPFPTETVDWVGAYYPLAKK
jgi:hypothetical protein